MIKVERVSKQFNGSKQTLALDNVTFDVEKKSFVVIVGPSGCGKTTLFNLIAGYDTPTQGNIKMNDELIDGPNFKRGVISQSTTLYPWYTVRKNIGYGMKARKCPKNIIQSKTDSLLEEIGLKEFENHYPFEISGGMQQRVSLARSLANEPEVVLLDEPLAALDALTRFSMQRFIHNLWLEKGLTFLMITHDIEEALLLGTKIIVFSKSPGTVLTTYYPKFYQENNWEHVSLTPEFIQMKKEILEQIR